METPISNHPKNRKNHQKSGSCTSASLVLNKKTLKLRYVHFMFIDNGAPDLALDFPKMASKKDKSFFSNAAKQTLIHTYSYYSIFYSIHECGFYPISNKTHMESRYVLPDRVRSIINVSFSLLFLAG